jgi:succinate-acetate transporter protein
MAQVQTATTPTTTTARPVANPAPLGLLGFGITTLVLSLVNTNLLGANLTADAVLPLALIFGGGAQLLAGMWEFHAGNTFGATAFTGFGAFWISFYFLVTQGFAAKAGSDGVATYILGWTIFTLILVFGAVRISGAMASLFILLFLTFLGLMLNDFGVLGTGNTTFTQVGGYLGILTAVVAFYIAAAAILKDLAGRDILPVFPMR